MTWGTNTRYKATYLFGVLHFFHFLSPGSIRHHKLVHSKRTSQRHSSLFRRGIFNFSTSLASHWAKGDESTTDAVWVKQASHLCGCIFWKRFDERVLIETAEGLHAWTFSSHSCSEKEVSLECHFIPKFVVAISRTYQVSHLDMKFWMSKRWQNSWNERILTPRWTAL